MEHDDEVSGHWSGWSVIGCAYLENPGWPVLNRETGSISWAAKGRWLGYQHMEAIMQTSIEGIYCNSLVAVFEAAFRLGYDPYALAAQAKLDVARMLNMSPSMLRQGPERVIDESLLVAKIISERWPIHERSGP